jgi:hypothetical protein
MRFRARGRRRRLADRPFDDWRIVRLTLDGLSRRRELTSRSSYDELASDRSLLPEPSLCSPSAILFSERSSRTRKTVVLFRRNARSRGMPSFLVCPPRTDGTSRASYDVLDVGRPFLQGLTVLPAHPTTHSTSVFLSPTTRRSFPRASYDVLDVGVPFSKISTVLPARPTTHSTSVVSSSKD